MCLDFSYFGIYFASWMCLFMPFTKFWKLTIISIFFSDTLFFFFWDSCDTNVSFYYCPVDFCPLLIYLQSISFLLFRLVKFFYSSVFKYSDSFSVTSNQLLSPFIEVFIYYIFQFHNFLDSFLNLQVFAEAFQSLTGFKSVHNCWSIFMMVALKSSVNFNIWFMLVLAYIDFFIPVCHFAGLGVIFFFYHILDIFPIMLWNPGPYLSLLF